ncbi:4a-hydroxytetrahydrobiopterin dehydratase [Prochlorococcus marinus]|uniref:4a-hydroxytetrahydrobiopterin dehydratase n=1 Tax=Prochlorococcus marinus TaxID=1219 RepID=UPI0022B4E781|nr:4a-hydroxytetrahydrobiopterin dehydratase [Prochlorococcus marinus]
MNKWKEKARPISMERRFEFSTYELTRDFLDRLGTLCEERNRFPDISFGKTYVNLTLKPEEDNNNKFTNKDREFAIAIDALEN